MGCAVRFRVHSPLFLHVLHIGQPKKSNPKTQTQKVKKKSKKVTPSLKSHPNSKKSKKNPFFFFFWIHFVTKMLIKCSNTSKKSYFHSKKSKKSKKVKKVKKNFFLFFRILCKKTYCF